MPQAQVGKVTLDYEESGDPTGPVLLLVSGLSGQRVSWDDGLCGAFIDRGFRLVRFDNRDVGRSTQIEDPRSPMDLIADRLSGGDATPPYVLADMADDAAGLLDALGVDAAHVFGVSMGGMIAQSLAIGHRDRVLSLTSVMSTTGDRDVGKADPAVFAAMIKPLPKDPEEALVHRIELAKTIGTPALFNEERARERAVREAARAADPLGVARQLLAVVSSPSRSEDLQRLDIAALVIHGDQDRLIDISGGQRTHECLSGSEFMVCEGMGHDLPEPYWEPIVDRVAAFA